LAKYYLTGGKVTEEIKVHFSRPTVSNYEIVLLKTFHGSCIRRSVCDCLMVMTVKWHRTRGWRRDMWVAQCELTTSMVH